jgi:RNA polymerase sigma-70 factor (ECF subfamily)
MNRMNRDLFWKLTEPEQLRARAFCRRLAGGPEDGDDLFQDALVAALRKFESLRDTSAFRAWLYRIIVNTFHNRIRQPWWKKLTQLSDEVEERLAGDDPTPRHAARRTLARAFREVSAEDRALVLLFELEGWTVAELSGLYARSEAAIKMRLSRTRRKMRETLAKHQARAGAATEAATKASESEICVAAKPGLE